MAGDDKQRDNSELRKTYSIPEIYDIAFDFRDVPLQVDALLDMAERHGGRKVKAALEMACGPAYHAREMSRRGMLSDGLDLDPNMIEYTRRLVEREGLPCRIIEGDMRSYNSEQKYDLVYNLLASFAQLLTNRDIVDNLNCAADLLNDGGIYVISTAHPREFYGDDGESEPNRWEMTRGDITVETDWGGDNQQFDPLTEIDDITVSFTVTTPDKTTRYDFPDRYRRCSIKTFEALVELSGRFEIMDMYGDIDKQLKLTNEKACWRFIPVLRKIK